MFPAEWTFSSLRILGLAIVRNNTVKSRKLYQGSFAICHCFGNHFSFCSFPPLGYVISFLRNGILYFGNYPLLSLRYDTLLLTLMLYSSKKHFPSCGQCNFYLICSYCMSQRKKRIFFLYSGNKGVN